MKNIVFLLLCLTISNAIFPQSIKQIKADTLTFIWGEGNGSTLKKAESEALNMITDNLNVVIKTDFDLIKNEITQHNRNFPEIARRLLDSYSASLLKNVEKIVISNEPSAIVFLYIKKSDIKRIFNERSEKILDFTTNGSDALKRRQVADALRYYYWAYTLLKSHPFGDSMTFINGDNQTYLLATWLPIQINSIFLNLSFGISESYKEGEILRFPLTVHYNRMPAVNFDYSFWDGSKWSDNITVKDGLGFIELNDLQFDEVKIKAEYLFEAESSIDRELGEVMKLIDPIPFRNSFFTVKKGFSGTSDASTESQFGSGSTAIWQKQNITLVSGTGRLPYDKSMRRITESVRNKDYSSVQNEFTTEGYRLFQDLVQYGQASILRTPEFNYIKFGKEVICRSLPLNFNFSNNYKQFVEEIVFHFDESGKICNLSFGLGSDAINDILNKGTWGPQVRLVLIAFLENYKTAYALKHLPYIENIFSDDALIIVGRVCKVNKDLNSAYADNRIIKYNHYSKSEYLKKLKTTFQSSEFINLEFEDSEIRKSGKGGEIYGIQIKQKYNSTNYGDTGYLFLLVDINNPELPVIHVRTWQPEKNQDGTIYGLADFN